MKKIKLGRSNLVTLVSDEDFDFLSQYKWHLGGNGYVLSGMGGKKRVFMHRLINNTPKGFDTDHINRNILDNRRENLRTVTKVINGRNRGENKNNTSGQRGVSWDKKLSKWASYIWVNYKKINLGYTKDLKEAIKIRLNGEKLYWND